jgi:hypothetical protein
MTWISEVLLEAEVRAVLGLALDKKRHSKVTIVFLVLDDCFLKLDPFHMLVVNLLLVEPLNQIFDNLIPLIHLSLSL